MHMNMPRSSSKKNKMQPPLNMLHTSLFLENLPTNVTSQALRKIFNQFCNEHSKLLRCDCDNNGCGYIVFDNRLAVDTVMDAKDFLFVENNKISVIHALVETPPKQMRTIGVNTMNNIGYNNKTSMNKKEFLGTKSRLSVSNITPMVTKHDNTHTNGHGKGNGNYYRARPHRHRSTPNIQSNGNDDTIRNGDNSTNSTSSMSTPSVGNENDGSSNDSKTNEEEKYTTLEDMHDDVITNGVSPDKVVITTGLTPMGPKDSHKPVLLTTSSPLLLAPVSMKTPPSIAPPMAPIEMPIVPPTPIPSPVELNNMKLPAPILKSDKSFAGVDGDHSYSGAIKKAELWTGRMESTLKHNKGIAIRIESRNKINNNIDKKDNSSSSGGDNNNDNKENEDDYMRLIVKKNDFIKNIYEFNYKSTRHVRMENFGELSKLALKNGEGKLNIYSNGYYNNKTILILSDIDYSLSRSIIEELNNNKFANGYRIVSTSKQSKYNFYKGATCRKSLINNRNALKSINNDLNNKTIVLNNIDPFDLKNSLIRSNACGILFDTVVFPLPVGTSGSCFDLRTFVAIKQIFENINSIINIEKYGNIINCDNNENNEELDLPQIHFLMPIFGGRAEFESLRIWEIGLSNDLKIQWKPKYSQPFILGRDNELKNVFPYFKIRSQSGWIPFSNDIRYIGYYIMIPCLSRKTNNNSSNINTSNTDTPKPTFFLQSVEEESNVSNEQEWTTTEIISNISNGNDEKIIEDKNNSNIYNNKDVNENDHNDDNDNNDNNDDDDGGDDTDGENDDKNEDEEQDIDVTNVQPLVKQCDSNDERSNVDTF